ALEAPLRSASSIWYALAGSAGMWLMAAARLGVALRGGIAIGLGAEIFEAECFGPALVDAYTLEHYVAAYPRVLVHPSVGQYLTRLESMPREDILGREAVKFAGMCRQLICAAPCDNLQMVHLFSRQLDLNVPLFAQFREPARAWVHAQQARFQNDAKLGP